MLRSYLPYSFLWIAFQHVSIAILSVKGWYLLLFLIAIHIYNRIYLLTQILSSIFYLYPSYIKWDFPYKTPVSSIPHFAEYHPLPKLAWLNNIILALSYMPFM